VHNSGTFCIVFFLRDPHVLEFLNSREDGSAQPAGVHAVSGTADFGSHVRGRQSRYLLSHAFLHALEHGAATSQHDVFEKVSLDVVLTLENGVEGVLGETVLRHVAGLAGDAGVEKHLGAADQFFADHNFILVGELVDLRAAATFVGRLQFSVEIRGYLSVLDLHLLALLEYFGVSNGLSHWVDVESVSFIVPFLLPQLEHVLSEILSADVDLSGGVGDSKALVDRHGVGDAVPRVNNCSSRSASREQTHDCLISEVELRDLELFEH